MLFDRAFKSFILLPTPSYAAVSAFVRNADLMHERTSLFTVFYSSAADMVAVICPTLC